jgi:pSer/pThr/pTyr-binding forkhead associated (FHA) protein
MASKFRLVMNSGPTAGTAYPLEKGEISIGRDLGNDIVINDPEVSRHHTRLFLQGDNYVVEDRGSTNGTSINGQRILGPYNLRPGELITLGEHISFIFESAQADPDATIVSSNFNPTQMGVPTPVQPVVSTPQPVAQPMTPPPPPQYNPPPPQYNPPPQQFVPPPPPPPAYVQPLQSYSGQVPMQPEQEKKKFPVWIIIAIVVILLLVCVCGIVLYFMPCSMWLPIVNLITPGTVCPP